MTATDLETPALPEWLASDLPDPEICSSDYVPQCNRCGGENKGLDDGWSQCLTCVVVYSEMGTTHPEDTAELRKWYAALPDSNPHQAERIDWKSGPPFVSSLVDLDRCAHCNAPKDYGRGHYHLCDWHEAVARRDTHNRRKANA
jgi:hypothetical protein